MASPERISFTVNPDGSDLFQVTSLPPANDIACSRRTVFYDINAALRKHGNGINCRVAGHAPCRQIRGHSLFPDLAWYNRPTVPMKTAQPRWDTDGEYTGRKKTYRF